MVLKDSSEYHPYAIQTRIRGEENNLSIARNDNEAQFFFKSYRNFLTLIIFAKFR